MRAWRITVYIFAIALLLALGFSAGAIYVRWIAKPASALAPVPPPGELSMLGKQVWELTGGVTVIEELMWMLHEEEMTGFTEPDELVRHAVSTVESARKLKELFSGEHPEYAGDPEYWLERWLFWNYIARVMGPSSASEQETERGISQARAGMKQFGETYAPITYRLCVDAGLSEQEKGYYFAVLQQLEPDNGYIDVMKAAKLHETATVDELLGLLKIAGEKPEFKVPVAPLTEVLAEHWVKRGEVVSPMLAFRYTGADPPMPPHQAYRLVPAIAGKLTDEELITAMPALKRTLVRLYRLEPPPAGIHWMSAAQTMLTLSRTATEAYIRAGNEEAVKQCRIQESRLSRLTYNAEAGIMQYLAIKGIVERGTGGSFRDAVIFSDFLRWKEFNDIERMNGLVDKYDEFEYPPLKPEPGAAMGGKAR